MLIFCETFWLQICQSLYNVYKMHKQFVVPKMTLFWNSHNSVDFGCLGILYKYVHTYYYTHKY